MENRQKLKTQQKNPWKSKGGKPIQYALLDTIKVHKNCLEAWNGKETFQDNKA